MVNRSFPWNNYNYKEVQGYILLTQRPALMSRKFKPLTLSKLPHLCGPGFFFVKWHDNSHPVRIRRDSVCDSPNPTPYPGPGLPPCPPVMTTLSPVITTKEGSETLGRTMAMSTKGAHVEQGRCEPKAVDVGSVL